MFEIILVPTKNSLHFYNEEPTFKLRYKYPDLVIKTDEDE